MQTGENSIIAAHIVYHSNSYRLQIDWYGFFGADTDILAIHEPIADTDNQCFQNFWILFSASLSKI